MNESKITATVVAKSLVVKENVLVRKADVVMTEVPAKQFVFEFATKVMKKADLNRNMRLTYTEMTQMLEGSHYQDFGRWVDSQKQKGFRRFDADKQGSIDMNELCDVVEEYALKGGKLEVEPHTVFLPPQSPRHTPKRSPHMTYLKTPLHDPDTPTTLEQSMLSVSTRVKALADAGVDSDTMDLVKVNPIVKTVTVFIHYMYLSL